MKKLYTMLVVMVLVVMMGMTSLAGTLQTYGTYRPYGAGRIMTPYSDKWVFLDEYDNLITIGYIDQNSIIIDKNGESLIFYCSDPINHPNTYTCYATDGVTPMFWIVLSDSNPSTFTYVINTIWNGGKTYATYSYLYS